MASPSEIRNSPSGPDGLLKYVALAFVIALVLYFAGFYGIEYERTRKGPWQVTFTNDAANAPAILINQSRLAITNVLITFPGETPPPAHLPVTLAFGQARAVPYDVPFGKCIFLDTTFLPGTVVFELFGHEIQLLPRVLTIDKREVPWRSNTTVPLAQRNWSAPPPVP